MTPKRRERPLPVTHSDLFGEDSDTDGQEGTSKDGDTNVLKSVNVKDGDLSSSSSESDSVILPDVGMDSPVSDDDAYDECLKLFKEEDKKCREAKEAAQHKVNTFGYRPLKNGIIALELVV